MKLRTLTLLITIFSSANAFCCGTTAQQFMAYWHYQDLNSKETFLKEYGCSLAMNYIPLVADEVIVRVLVDAIDNKVKRNVIAKVIKSHNCLFAARQTPEYAVIKEFVSSNGLSEYCSKERLESSYVVLANGGVNLRVTPSANGEKLAAIADGTLVKVLSKSGEWALVESYAGKGYVYTPLLKAL